MLSRLENITNAQVGLLLGILAVVGLGISASAHILDAGMSSALEIDDWWAWMDGAFQNFSTEVIGAILTFGLIEVLVGARDRRAADAVQVQKDEQEREERRKSNQLQAVSELKRAQTPEERQPILDRMKADGLLQGANLRRVNLLEANLLGTKLQGANLHEADLELAQLRVANLQGAGLKKTNLRGANLWAAKLQGATLWDANLRGAKLKGADLDSSTMLPNFTMWTPETDMSRYTDPEHPDFWQPDWVKEQKDSDGEDS